MANVVEAKAGVLILIGFDAIAGGSTDRRRMKAPGTFFCFTYDCITGGVVFEDFVFEAFIDYVGSACVFKCTEAVECGTDVARRYGRSHGNCNPRRH